MDLNNRWFNAQPVHAELSPVTDFREACCRQYEMGCVSLPPGVLERVYSPVLSPVCSCLPHAPPPTCLDRECTRGGFCNFMHLKPISRELRRELYGRRRKRFVHHHHHSRATVHTGPLTDSNKHCRLILRL